MIRIIIGTNKGFVYKSEHHESAYGIDRDVNEAHVFSTKIRARARAENLMADGVIKSYFLLQII